MKLFNKNFVKFRMNQHESLHTGSSEKLSKKDLEKIEGYAFGNKEIKTKKEAFNVLALADKLQKVEGSTIYFTDDEVTDKYSMIKVLDLTALHFLQGQNLSGVDKKIIESHISAIEKTDKDISKVLGDLKSQIKELKNIIVPSPTESPDLAGIPTEVSNPVDSPTEAPDLYF